MADDSPTPLFPPRRDADLARWSDNFASMISASPAAFGLSAAQASGFSHLSDAYASALSIAITPTTNSRANVREKNDARKALLDATNGARELVRIVQAYPGTTDAIRSQLGLPSIDAGRSRVGPPDGAPKLSVESSAGRTINIRLRDQGSPDRRGKPAGADGAIILYYVAEDRSDAYYKSPPSDQAQWTFGRMTARPLFQLNLPASIPSGSKVWLSALWFNARKETGPASTPQFAIAGGGLAKLAA